MEISDSTQPHTKLGQSEFAGYFLPYWRYTDHSIEAVKPPVQAMLLSSNPDDIKGLIVRLP